MLKSALTCINLQVRRVEVVCGSKIHDVTPVILGGLHLDDLKKSSKSTWEVISGSHMGGVLC